MGRRRPMDYGQKQGHTTRYYAQTRMTQKKGHTMQYYPTAMPNDAISRSNKAKRRDIMQKQLPRDVISRTNKATRTSKATRRDIMQKLVQTTRCNAKTRASDTILRKNMHAISRQKTSQTTRYHASTSQTRPYHATTRPTMRYYAEQGQTTPTMPTMPSLESLCMQMPSPRPRRRRRGGYPSRRRSP